MTLKIYKQNNVHLYVKSDDCKLYSYRYSRSVSYKRSNVDGFIKPKRVCMPKEENSVKIL